MRISTRTYARRHCQSEGLLKALEKPQAHEIMDTVDRQPGRVYGIMSPAQQFKTAVGQALALRFMHVDPADTGWYCQTEVATKQFADGKFNKAWDSCPPLQSLIKGDPESRPKAVYHCTHGFSLQIMSAGVEMNRNSITLKRIFRDEPWTYDQGWADEITMRRASYADSKDWLDVSMLTGPTEGTDAAGLWRRSDQRTWHSVCPECGHAFPMEFGSLDEPGGIRYDSSLAGDGSTEPNWKAIRESVRYECPGCHVHIRQSPAVMVQMNDPALGARYAAMNPEPDPTVVFWRCPGPALIDWGDLVCEWILANAAKSRGDLAKLREFVQKRLAKVWTPKEFFKAIKGQRQIGTYAMGQDWEKEVDSPWKGFKYRFCTVDMQKDHFVVEIRTWARDAESRLLWAEKVFSAGRIADLCEKHRVHPNFTAIDGRWNKTEAVRLAARFGWAIFMGDSVDSFRHSDGLRRMYSESRDEDPGLGTALGGREVVPVVMFSKDSALGTVRLLKAEQTKDGSTKWTAAKDAPQAYHDEQDGIVAIEIKRDGEVCQENKQVGPDHFLDTTCMQVVFASMAGFIGVGWSGDKSAG
jgi:hypothetical protein